jgi:hypothetical protein
MLTPAECFRKNVVARDLGLGLTKERHAPLRGSPVVDENWVLAVLPVRVAGWLGFSGGLAAAGGGGGA